MNAKQAKSIMRQKWPWLAALAPLLAIGADNLIGPALSGQAAQKAFSKAVVVAVEPMFEKLHERIDDIEPCRERRSRRRD